jgi:hypothetical protein
MPVSPWQTRFDLAFAHGLRLVGWGELAEVRPDLCLFLADRYWRLADYHRVQGRERAARRLEQKAERYFVEGGGEDPPPTAVAVAMPVPTRPRITWARARRGGLPPDAA